ncbi:hypothetical protein KO353_02965 [Elioraea tepida]|jgi:hypothetical protein|uniref:Uncharacterized protein n=1 Tax=Elioraea tepida TaxID=2843330 RepID=A0A975YJX6_9PROT|nr:hypothetical protein [Elioraea tepida]QXM25225.1 hypothetical protein KO353_02965 [Elioraea tepida]
MDGATFAVLNLLLVKGPILAIALYQLWSLRFYPKPPGREERAAPPPTPRGDDRKEMPRKPLPDCLIPRPLALPAPERREERVRELA